MTTRPCIYLEKRRGERVGGGTRVRTFKAMETAFYSDAKRELLDGLALCTNGQQLRFKRLYAGGHLELPIEQVVANMSRAALSRAMQQVLQTLQKG